MQRDARIIQRAVWAAYRRIYAVASRIPRGRVMTYGAVARLSGLPRGARVVGYAMKASLSSKPVPWWRVVGLRRAGVAHVSIKDPVGGAEQRRRLEREGIEFSDDDGIDLDRYGVGPETPRARKQRGRPDRSGRPRKR